MQKHIIASNHTCVYLFPNSHLDFYIFIGISNSGYLLYVTILDKRHQGFFKYGLSTEFYK